MRLLYIRLGFWAGCTRVIEPALNCSSSHVGFFVIFFGFAGFNFWELFLVDGAFPVPGLGIHLFVLTPLRACLACFRDLRLQSRLSTDCVVLSLQPHADACLGLRLGACLFSLMG